MTTKIIQVHFRVPDNDYCVMYREPGHHTCAHYDPPNHECHVFLNEYLESDVSGVKKCGSCREAGSP